MKPIDPDGFEAMFRRTADPWGYRTSRFEKKKRQVLLRACGPNKLGRGLELACAIGETSRELTSRCLTLVATDGAPTALAQARSSTSADARIEYRHGILPRQMPQGPFDLIVVSEIAYYLSRRDLLTLAVSLVKAVARGGRIVVLHHTVPFDDAAQPPAFAQALLRRALSRRMILVHAERYGRYEVVALRRRQDKPAARRKRKA